MRAIFIRSRFFPGLPSAAVGALAMLWLFNMELSIIAMIGILMLIGIVKKNAIMMIDFALDAERNDGMPPQEAIRTACLLRFRPIMMTTLAALMGALPIALGLGRRCRIAPAAGTCRGWGVVILPGHHAFHYARDLSLPESFFRQGATQAGTCLTRATTLR